MSSPGFSCAWNGSGSALLSSSIFVATTSTWPVRIFGLTLERRRTVPVMRRQSSYPTAAAAASTSAFPSASDGSATICTMPSWSRRSMKTRPPRLRATSAQPHRVTVWPTSASSTRPQKWVRMDAPDGAREVRRKALHSSRRGGAGRRSGATSGARRRLALGLRRRGLRLRLRRLGVGLGSALAREVALLVAVLLEVGLVPAAAREAEAGRRQLALDRRRAAIRAGVRVGIGKLLQAVEAVAAGGADEGVDGHGRTVVRKSRRLVWGQRAGNQAVRGRPRYGFRCEA